MKKFRLESCFLCLVLLFGCLGDGFGTLSQVMAEEGPTNYEVVEVSASEHDGNVPENTIDDDLSTRWSAQGEGQWILFDLGEAKEVGYLGIAFHSGDIRRTIIDIEVSLNPNEGWTKVVDRKLSSGESVNLEAFDFADQEARYIRITAYGNSVNAWNSLTAVHVYAPYNGGPVVKKLGAVFPGPDPDAAPYSQPGLVQPDGTDYLPHIPNAVTGSTINVVDFGADPRDNAHDDLPAILQAIEAAKEGDEVYFPNGVYHLRSGMPNDGTSHIYLKDGVNLRGESQESVKLISHFDAKESPNSKVITAYGKKNILVSNITISSSFDGDYSVDPSINNPERGGPAYGIFIADYASKPSQHITIAHVTVEKFQRMGVRIEKSSKNIVEHSTFRKATDVGGGGAGYGISIQGIQGIHRLGHANDTYFNVVRNNSFEGPYMRHGTLVQNFAHNNLITNNLYTENIHDAIDLHGQGEYLNEISHNEIDGVPRGGIGVGNTGGTAPNSHSASGTGNYIHQNTLKNTRDGITVIMGSPDTVIENNTIVNTRTPANAKGIYLLNAPRTIVKDNKIINNSAPGFWAIVVAEDFGDRNNQNKGAGIPEDIVLLNNKIVNNRNGIKLEAGRNIILEKNKIINTKEIEFLSLLDDADDGEEEEELVGTVIHPSDDALVDIERPESNYGILHQDLIDNNEADKNYYRYFNIKRNGEGSKGRVGFYKFDFGVNQSIERATFSLTGKTGSNTESVNLAVYGILNNGWDEETLVWNNAPNLSASEVKVTDVGGTAIHLGTITIDTPVETSFSLNVGDFLKQYAGQGEVSFIVVDVEGQNGNVNIYSKEEANSTRWPQLFIETKE